MNILSNILLTALLLSGCNGARSYIVPTDVTSADGARAICESLGSTLATVIDAGDVASFDTAIGGAYGTYFWIGTQRNTDGEFVWDDGTQCIMQTPTCFGQEPDCNGIGPCWNEGEPNDSGGTEDCTVVWLEATDGSMRANDGVCTGADFRFVCNGKYRFINQNIMIADAKQACYDQFGTDLASIHSASDQKEVTDLCKDVGGACWTGGRLDANCEYPYEDGTAYDYTPVFDGGQEGCDPNQPRLCISENKYGLHNCNEGHTGFPICNAPSEIGPPINCLVSDWNDGTNVCSEPCGPNGVITRQREIIQENENGGSRGDCDVLQQEFACNTDINCPVDCVVSDWSEFGECNKRYCGGGTQERTRDIMVNAAYNGEACPALDDTRDCNIDNCCPAGINTFDWDKLVEEGADNIPNINVRDFSVIPGDLSLKVVIELDYMGAASADNEEVANFGVTYILDFEDYAAHKDKINEPGTCQNRIASSFTDKTFDEFWEYSLEPQNDGGIGSNNYLSYPPPSTDDKWKISMLNDGCDTIVYEGHFTWQQLRDCTAFEGGDSYTKVDADDNWLNLTGTFYVNIVSPFWYGSTIDTEFYRVYQLLSQPFVIAVSSTVYVLGHTGINLMTISIIAVYKEDQQSDFKLVVLTETAEYMQLTRVGTEIFEFLPSNGIPHNYNFIPPTGPVNTDCVANKNYLCSQLWVIEARDVPCISDVSGTDFSGTYSLTFTAQCIDQTTPLSEGNYCLKWLNDHPDIRDNDISLTANLVWKDEICDPKIFTVQLESEMSFYAPINPDIDIYDAVNKITNSYLYQVGEDRISVEIYTNFPGDDGITIFNTKLINVWICTFAPDITVPSVLGTAENHGITAAAQTMGCFNDGRDKEFDDYFYHIFSSTQTMQPVPDDIDFSEDSIDGVHDRKRFSFNVPYEVARDALYIHVQIEVELREEIPRRMLLNVNTANKIQHFGDQIGINHGEKPEKPQNPPPPKQPKEPYYYNPSSPSSPSYVLSLSSSWIIIIGSLLGLILIINIGFMFYINCYNKRGSRKNGRYSSVKNNDSEYFDESEVKGINVISE